MANIPKYQSGQISLSSFPNIFVPPSASPGSFGANKAQAIGGLSQGISQLSSELLKIEAIKQEKLNKSITQDALTKAQREIDDLLFGDNGYYTRKGKDVENLIQNAQRDFEKIKRSYQSDLTSNQVKDMFNISFDDFTSRNLSALSQYRSNEIENFRINTLDAQIKQDHDNTIKNRNNPEIIENNIQDIILNTIAKYKGMGSEIQTKAVNDALNLLHADMLEVISAESIDNAKAYLKKYWDDINPIAREKIKNALNKEDIKNKARQLAFEISQENIDLGVQLDMADKIKNPELRELTIGHVKNLHSDKENVKKLRKQRFEESEWDKLFANPLTYEIPSRLLDADTEKSMQKWQEDKKAVEFAKAGISESPKQKKNLYYYNFMILPDEELAGMSFDEVKRYANKVHPDDFHEIFEHWKKGKEDIESVKPLRTPRQFIDAQAQMLGDLKYDSDDSPEVQKEKRKRKQRLFTAFDDEIRKLDEKDRTEKNMQEIADKLLQPFTTFKGRNKQYYRYEAPYLNLKGKTREKYFESKRNLPINILNDYYGTNEIEYLYDDNLKKFIYQVKMGPDHYYIFDEDGDPITERKL